MVKKKKVPSWKNSSLSLTEEDITVEEIDKMFSKKNMKIDEKFSWEDCKKYEVGKTDVDKTSGYYIDDKYFIKKPKRILRTLHFYRFVLLEQKKDTSIWNLTCLRCGKITVLGKTKGYCKKKDKEEYEKNIKSDYL